MPTLPPRDYDIVAPRGCVVHVRHVPWHRRARLALNLAALIAVSLVLWLIILTPVATMIWPAVR